MRRLQRLVANMADSASNNRTLTKHWNNESQAAFMSKESRDALEGKLDKIGVNFVRLAINALVQRLTLRGWHIPGTAKLDPELIEIGQRVNLPAVSETIHVDRALYGCAYLTAWTTRDGSRPVLIADTGATASVEVDPATGEVLRGARVWRRGDTAHAVYFTPESVIRYTADVIEGTELTGATVWKQNGKRQDNPLQVVPMVPFIRKQSSLDDKGVSAVADILGLENALAKVLSDAMVTSEYFAKPRRWATGLEIQEDENGKPIDPFGKRRLLQSEDPETKFGQLPASDPTGQTELIATITQMIGALTGLPAHYLGLHGDQPPSSEGVRAAETQLVMTAKTEMKYLDGPWARVAALLLALSKNGHPDDYPRITQWENAEIKTPAQAADAAGKLRDIGLPLATLLHDPLGYAPDDIPDIVSAAELERATERTRVITNRESE